MRDRTDKNKTSLSITTLNTYLINSLIISLLIKYLLFLFFSLLIKSFFPFSLQFLLCFYFLSFFLPEYHFPYTCFIKCSRKNIHGKIVRTYRPLAILLSYDERKRQDEFELQTNRNFQHNIITLDQLKDANISHFQIIFICKCRPTIRK